MVPRLLPLGLAPQTIAENLIAVINQRLVRRNCRSAAKRWQPAPPRQWLGAHACSHVKRGRGCEHCGDSGFLGHLPVYEILLMDEALGNAIADGASRSTMRDVALKAGFASMLEMARWRIAQGQTTFDEIARVIGEGPQAP